MEKEKGVCLDPVQEKEEEESNKCARQRGNIHIVYRKAHGKQKAFTWTNHDRRENAFEFVDRDDAPLPELRFAPALTCVNPPAIPPPPLLCDDDNELPPPPPPFFF